MLTAIPRGEFTYYKGDWRTGCQLSNNAEKDFLDKLWPGLHIILYGFMGSGY